MLELLKVLEETLDAIDSAAHAQIRRKGPSHEHQGPTRRIRRRPEAPSAFRRWTGHSGGVAAGLAAFFGLDVTHVRIAFVVLSFLGGAGLPLYLAAVGVDPRGRLRTSPSPMESCHAGGHWS